MESRTGVRPAAARPVHDRHSPEARSKHTHKAGVVSDALMATLIALFDMAAQHCRADTSVALMARRCAVDIDAA